MYKQREDCCKHQDAIAKLTKKRIKKKHIDADDECEEQSSGMIPVTGKKKSATNRPRYVSESRRIIERIKPAVNVRDEYSYSRHVRCVIDNSDKDPRGYGNSPVGSTKKSQREKRTTNISNSTRMPEQKINGSNKNVDFKRVMSKKHKHLEWPKELSTDSDTSSECDEICSFDSDVNLSGVTLTAEDQQKIVENRMKTHPPLLNNTNKEFANK